jgi:CubicO group peptidase (beta-lactamase class C family)
MYPRAGGCRTPDGGIVSTVSDLATFIEALFDGRLLARDTLAQMTGNTRTEKRYGLGTYGWSSFRGKSR